MSELKIVDLTFFIFFYFLDLGSGFSMTSHVTITNCYMSWSHNHILSITLLSIANLLLLLEPS